MNGKIAFFYVAAALVSFVGAVLGLLVGALLGGNAIFIAQYAGLDGYESTGLFGAVIGASLLCLLFTLLFWKKEQTHISLLWAVIACALGGIILYLSVASITPNILLYGWIFPSVFLLAMQSFFGMFKKTTR